MLACCVCFILVCLTLGMLLWVRLLFDYCAIILLWLGFIVGVCFWLTLLDFCFWVCFMGFVLILWFVFASFFVSLCVVYVALWCLVGRGLWVG